MQFSHRTGRPIDLPGEQLIELQLALCDNTGKSKKLHYTLLRVSIQRSNQSSFPSNPAMETSLLHTGRNVYYQHHSSWQPQIDVRLR